MSRSAKLARYLSGFLFVLFAGCSSVGRLSGSDEKIQAAILKQTPLGCSSSQVHDVIKRQHWKIHDESADHGFIKHGEDKFSSVEIGSRSVTCELGSTFFELFPLKTVVFADWGFDRNGRLIEVWIDKQTDAL